MNLTFRQLRLFMALSDTGSVSKAARLMHVTQPTASAQLKEMTESVGLPLYEVISRKVYLTETGKELAQTARRMLHEWENFAQRCDASKGLQRGRLKVAAVNTAKYFVPRMVGQFCKKHPAIDVSLEILNRDGVLNRLRDNLDDIYIMSMPPADIELVDHIFMENPLIVIAPANSPLAQQKKLTARHLKGERFIVREKGSGTRMATDRHFQELRFRPQIRMELGSNEAIKEAVAAGLGLGILSMHALQPDAHASEVTVLDVREFPIQSQWHIVHLEQKKLSPIAALFKDELLKSALY